MNVLAFDTSMDACSVAAGRGLTGLCPAISAVFEPMASGQAERLVPMIAEVLAATDLSAGDLDLIAVTVGPGTFTGTRITTAAARALALVSGTPLAGVSSLALMAMNHRADVSGASELAIAVDVRRGEVYLQRFEPQTLVAKGPPAAMPVGAAASLIADGCTLAGSAAGGVADRARAAGKTVRTVALDLLPDALDMLWPARFMPRVNTVDALYLRPPDAKPPAAAAVARI